MKLINLPFLFPQKTSQTSQSISENADSEKGTRRQTHVEEPHKTDGEQINVLKVNKDSEKRADPRLKKVSTGSRELENRTIELPILN